MATRKIYIGADCEVSYEGAAVLGVYQITGTCTYSLKNAAGTVLGTGTLAYVALSNGNYIGVIESTVTALLAEGATYYLFITFNQGSNDDYRRIVCEAVYREDY